MKKVFLMILVLAALAVSCISGFRYTELMAYDPDEDWQRIANSEYAYLTEPRGSLAEADVVSWFADYLVAAERMYVGAVIGEDTYAKYYRCVDCSGLSSFALELPKDKFKAIPLDDIGALMENMGESDNYNFNSILAWFSAHLGQNYAIIEFTAKNYQVTQSFYLEGDYRDRWEKLWYECINECYEISPTAEELWDVLLYGDEYYESMKEEKLNIGILEHSRPVDVYKKPFPQSITVFSETGGVNDI